MAVQSSGDIDHGLWFHISLHLQNIICKNFVKSCRHGYYCDITSDVIVVPFIFCGKHDEHNIVCCFM